jgi:hypothetical protein
MFNHPVNFPDASGKLPTLLEKEGKLKTIKTFDIPNRNGEPFNIRQFFK